jgi:hypothetical protein
LITKFSLLFVPFLCGLSLKATAQQKAAPDESPDLAFAIYRTSDTVPPYDLDKVKALIDSEKRREKKPGSKRLGDTFVILPDHVFAALPFEEKFTYVMIHPETYSQNCSAAVFMIGSQERITGWLPGSRYSMLWSQRQTDFLHKNRSMVIALLKQEIERGRHVGLNIKHAVSELNADSLIPSLVAAFQRDKKDVDILALLIMLMKQGNCASFRRTPIYDKLYGKRIVRGLSMPAEGTTMGIPANDDNEKLIESQAMAFYASGVK